MRLPADERRQQLLAVACDLFARSGYHDTSMDDIAEGAGVTKPVLYQHFPSKRALYAELLDDTVNRLLDRLSEATGRATSGRAERGDHVLDPRTLRPARGLMSATVIASDLAIADAFATAAVAGGTLAAPWLTRPGMAAFGITDDGAVVATPGFEAFRAS